MTGRITRCGPWLITIVAGAFSLWGCTEEKLVYVDKPLWEDPPAAALGFMGYSDSTAKQTTCGNCHAGQQGAWKVSAHSNAMTDLVDSGHASDSCVACHSVSELGSSATGTVAYMATKSPRYQDVQCENCHNGGQAHIANPSRTQPLASIAVFKNDEEGVGCAECHTDTHHPYYEEWAASRHAIPNDHVTSRRDTDPAGWANCGFCHEGKEALKTQFKVTSNYLEKNDASFQGVTCAVCHDPHGSPNTAQLRLSISARNIDDNLCIKCHQRRPNPQLTSSSGAHSPQGPTVLGISGWRPAGFAFGDAPMISTHGSEANPQLCAGCHVQSFAVNSTTNATGHLFKATPCMDAATGKPTSDDCPITQQRFKACTASGCHGSEAAARSALIANEARLTALTVEVNRLVALVPKTEFNTADTQITVGEGAKFNGTLFAGDGSRGVHNPFLLEALLNASISSLKSTYKIQ
jgi:predicted CXXCH cytochrome family protein